MEDSFLIVAPMGVMVQTVPFLKIQSNQSDVLTVDSFRTVAPTEVTAQTALLLNHPVLMEDNCRIAARMEV